PRRFLDIYCLFRQYEVHRHARSIPTHDRRRCALSAPAGATEFTTGDSTMATDTVLITHVTGKAWMRASDGTMVALHEGMRVPVNAHIMTDEGASVTLQATGVPPVIVGQNTDMLVTD